MTSGKSRALAVCLVASFLSAAYAQDASNGVTLRTPGGPPAPRGGSSVAVPVGGPWIEIAFGAAGSFAYGCQATDCTPSSGGNSVPGGDPPWTFTAPAGGATLIVTDAFLSGDRFQIFDFGAAIGATSIPSNGGDCGDDPDPCVADPLVSHGFFSLAPGPHKITIQMLASPFDAGAAYFRIEPSAMDFYSVTPCRVVDTRWADGPWGGPFLTSEQPRSFLIAGECGIPDDAQAVSLNITALDPTGPGYLRVFRAGMLGASTSHLSFGAGQTRANFGFVALAGGRLSVGPLVAASPGNVHVVIDVNGYFR
jgi:hypothetical protein